MGSLEEARPVILVPKEPLSGNIWLETAKALLIDGKYKNIQDKKSSGSDNHFIEIQTDLNNQQVVFEVCDDLAYLHSANKL